MTTTETGTPHADDFDTTQGGSAFGGSATTAPADLSAFDDDRAALHILEQPLDGRPIV